MLQSTLLLLVASALAGLAGPASATDSTPPTYAECGELGLTDPACHQQVIQAGGTPRAVSNVTRAFETRNFHGRTEMEHWYHEYKEHCKRNSYTVLPLASIIHRYPNFPTQRPSYIIQGVR